METCNDKKRKKILKTKKLMRSSGAGKDKSNRILKF